MKRFCMMFSFLVLAMVSPSCKDAPKEETSSEDKAKTRSARGASTTEAEPSHGEPKPIYELLGESGVKADPKPKGGKTIVVGRNGLYEKKESPKENQSQDKE